MSIIIPKSYTFQKPQTQEKYDGENFIYGFIGINRTGKSTKANQVAHEWKMSRPKGIVVAHDPQSRFRDVADYLIASDDQKWAVKCLALRNALIILDDVRILHEQNTPMEGVSDLLQFRAQYNIDIIWIVHNPALILNILAGFTTRYHIFFTLAQEGSFQRKIPNYSLCIAASNVVNDYVHKYGRGQYPHFPYSVVDCERQKIYAINMKTPNL